MLSLYISIISSRVGTMASILNTKILNVTRWRIVLVASTVVPDHSAAADFRNHGTIPGELASRDQKV